MQNAGALTRRGGVKTAPAGAECVICLEGTSTADNPLGRDCACRGSAGWSHVPCLISAAKQKSESWSSCPTCKQRWTGRTRLKLAEARVTHDIDNPTDNIERITALDEFAMAMDEEADDPQAALAYFQEAQRIETIVHGEEHERVMASKVNTATLQMQRLRDPRGALPVLKEVLQVQSRVLGEAHE